MWAWFYTRPFQKLCLNAVVIDQLVSTACFSAWVDAVLFGEGDQQKRCCGGITWKHGISAWAEPGGGGLCWACWVSPKRNHLRVKVLERSAVLGRVGCRMLFGKIRGNFVLEWDEVSLFHLATGNLGRGKDGKRLWPKRGKRYFSVMAFASSLCPAPPRGSVLWGFPAVHRSGAEAQRS